MFIENGDLIASFPYGAHIATEGERVTSSSLAPSLAISPPTSEFQSRYAWCVDGITGCNKIQSPFYISICWGRKNRFRNYLLNDLVPLQFQGVGRLFQGEECVPMRSLRSLKEEGKILN